MAFGPGKYDDLCTAVRVEASAQGVVLIVIKGALGSGFSCQSSPEVLAKLPETLEAMAAQIRADRAKATGL